MRNLLSASKGFRLATAAKPHLPADRRGASSSPQIHFLLHALPGGFLTHCVQNGGAHD
jgi:hypothetical protein